MHDNGKSIAQCYIHHTICITPTRRVVTGEILLNVTHPWVTAKEVLQPEICCMQRCITTNTSITISLKKNTSPVPTSELHHDLSWSDEGWGGEREKIVRFRSNIPHPEIMSRSICSFLRLGWTGMKGYPLVEGKLSAVKCIAFECPSPPVFHCAVLCTRLLRKSRSTSYRGIQHSRLRNTTEE